MSNNLIHSIRHFIYRSKYRYGQHLPLEVPVDVSLELSSLCNMSCTYCYHADQENLPFKKGMMSYEIGEKIIRESAEIGVNSLKFNFRGESTINPNFSRLTGLAKSLARGSTFIDRLTNSNFKFQTTRDDIFDGLCNQTKVKISYDSFDANVFETQRAGGDHSITSRNIEKFYHYPKRKETEIVIQSVRTKLNKNEDLAGEIKKRWPTATISIRDMVAGRVDNDLSKLEDKKRDDSERQSCLQAHVRLMFTWEGKALGCCPMINEEVVLGDVKKQTVHEIFNSKNAKKLRRMLKDKTAFEKINSCKNCSSFESYKGFSPSWNS